MTLITLGLSYIQATRWFQGSTACRANVIQQESLHISPVKHVPGVWRSGVDPGGIEPREPAQPPGMGDVCLRLLLHHDLPLDDHLHGRMPQEQLQLGRRCKTRVQMSVKPMQRE